VVVGGGGGGQLQCSTLVPENLSFGFGPGQTKMENPILAKTNFLTRSDPKGSNIFFDPKNNSTAFGKYSPKFTI
jgi:hypothetical protein